MPDTGQSIDTATVWAQIQAQHAERQRLADEIRPHNKAAILAALAATGVAFVIVRFDGSGDSGQIEEVSAFANGDLIDIPNIKAEISTPTWDGSKLEPRTLSLSAAIEQLAYDLLEETHDGWEINEGAYGEFSFDVGGNAIKLDYHERIETTEFSGHEW
jgi:hypothetical protein